MQLLSGFVGTTGGLAGLVLALLRCLVTGILLCLELALVFPEEEGMMQQSSVSISLSF